MKMKIQHGLKYLLLPFMLLLSGCATGAPEGVAPVRDFDVQRYLGTWYEIARLDHRFERGLTDVTAHYSLRNDGKIAVVNKGYNPQKCEWDTAEGRAKFIDGMDKGSLAVSFFGPFYGGYHVFALDHENYQWAAISGPSHQYLWFLARSPELSPETVKKLEDKARAAGFPVDDLIYVGHDQPEGNKKCL